MIFDDRICALGEGPLWHPQREQLFWFDILGKRLLSRTGDAALEWSFDEHVSAAGWVDRSKLLVASESRLFLFDVDGGTSEDVCPLEADIPATQSNDGRADPAGGFWIGTMGKAAEPIAGAIWRYHRGEVRKLFDRITVSNSICFSPDGACAYFTDTWSKKVRKVSLDADGWPVGEPEVFLDLRSEGLNPDGSVVDRDGCLWNAQWGSSRVARYSADGQFMDAIEVPANQASCPAFGGEGLTTLFVTSAADRVTGPDEGKTFAFETDATGQAEHQVIL